MFSYVQGFTQTKSETLTYINDMLNTYICEECYYFERKGYFYNNTGEDIVEIWNLKKARFEIEKVDMGLYYAYFVVQIGETRRVFQVPQGVPFDEYRNANRLKNAMNRLVDFVIKEKDPFDD
jgi:hypothetical protein